MAQQAGQHGRQYICVDKAAQAIGNGAANQDGTLLYVR